MNTQYEKNSIYIAGAHYRMRRRDRELKIKLAVFFAFLAAVCAVLYTVVLMVS